jgi:hypothetical protein
VYIYGIWPFGLKAGEVRVMAMAALPIKFSRISVASRMLASLKTWRKRNEGRVISSVRTGAAET